MSDLDLFHGPNAGYVLDLYDRFLQDSASVGPEWQTYFSAFNPTRISPNGPAATSIAPPTSVTHGVSTQSIVGAATLAQSIREYGHLAARIDPLGSPPLSPPDLDMSTHGVTEADLAALPASVVGGPVAEESRNALDAINRLKMLYANTVGYDFDHVRDPDERVWLVEAVESHRFEPSLERSAKRALLRRLTYVEGLERFLHQTYLGQKRFSIEGNDMLVPMLDEIVSRSAANGIREIIIGMAHRGRLNVLAHILGKPYSEIVAAFEGARLRRPVTDEESDTTPDFSGDVKYHLGARLLRDEEGSVVEVPMVLTPNPSHLEAVNPIVEGMVRSSQDVCNQPGAPWRDHKASEAILLHGDAAFPGQGVVAETLNLSALPGYSTGGTIHIIVNNQIGFTTLPNQSRSTLYAGDLAKGFEIPVVRVNADDPEAASWRSGWPLSIAPHSARTS